MASVITRLIIILFAGFSQATNVTVTFTVKHHMVGDERYLFFMCFSNGVPQGCSVEFLKNNRTIDNLRRFSDGNCYHRTRNVCEGDECSCSSDCMNFTLKYVKTEIRTGDIFSCKMKIKEQERIWTDIKDYAVVFDGTGFVFKSSKETTVTQSGVDEPTIKESSDNTEQIVRASNPDLCDYYTTLAPCTSLQTCKISNGQPSCVNLNVSEKDNLPLIIGVSIGGVLLILTLALIFVLIAMQKRRTHRWEPNSNSGSPINHDIGMGLTYSFLGDQSHYAGDPDIYNPAFIGSDAGSEMDYPQGLGDLEGQNEFHIRRPQIHIDYNYSGKR